MRGGLGPAGRGGAGPGAGRGRGGHAGRRGAAGGAGRGRLRRARRGRSRRGPVAEGAERCHTSELGGSLVADPAGGAAGSTYATLVLRNDGGRTCVVRGFPGLSYVGGDDGAQVGPAAAMQGGHGDPVQLAPGASAGARVRMVNAHNFDPADCAPVPTRGFRVYPPGETDSLFVAQDGTGCSGRPPGDQLTVEAFGPQ
ncbi:MULTISPECIES: DUF4232 domain-containing protein [unclassified Pseudonocardia]|uniref:DUF4232 domain-containing protein n=1 Tax=unclassified Pseudonocardia TaxID=2619320 RepID=UPI00076120A2|nr:MULTISPECIES: DUF4232 domain-containing protein [unclassified Pseudonocardia]